MPHWTNSFSSNTAPPLLLNGIKHAPARIILRAPATEIPGNPQDRQNTVANLFCELLLQRPFHRNIEACGYDFSHATPDFDTDKPVRRWFILDLGVDGTLTRDEVLSLPHEVYQLTKQDDGW